MEPAHHGLKQDLRLRDLVAMQLAIVVWLGWTGFAAKQGASQLILWLLAMALFYVPLAAVVMQLSRAIPLEGGVYQWVKQGISPFAGYVAAWNFSAYGLAAFAVTGSLLANAFAYAAGARGAWMLSSRPFAMALTAASCLTALVFNLRGMKLASWWSNVGAVLTGATFVAMLYLLARAWIARAPQGHGSFSLAWPEMSLLTVSVFAKMAISALSGFDSSGILAEECRKPENDVARSVLIAAPLIAVMYILGTITVLAYVAPADVDLAATVPQLMKAGFGDTFVGHAITAIGVAALNIAFVSVMIVVTGMISRLPMVAGWDGLLPGWWSELHPVYRTPYKAIAVVVGTIFALGALSLWGASGNQEAVQIGVSGGAGSLCIMYMLLFAATRRLALPIRIAAAAAFLVSLVSMIFQIVPVADVANKRVFAVKVIAVMIATNAVGTYLYFRGTRRQRTLAAQAGG